ncbi:hypothetical protein [Roseateles flavus]|uniref:Aromatic ring-opening dioxygenase LigA n=1 Tax=Roseateles flavus TaxID=3149041 RepID=A0ABV0GIM8_9BURK
MDIQLNFINQSNDASNSEVVVFQRHTAGGSGDLAVAWTVIKNCGQGSHHPFVYPLSLAVGARDSDGNYTPQLPAQDGELFKMTLTPSGNQLVPAGAGASPQEVQVLNALDRGAIDALCFRDGRLLAVKHGVAPQQTASFQFKPTIWIGVVSQVQTGEVMNAALLSELNTEISLLGIASADIVMTGGGAGPASKPFAFELQNIVMA